MIFVREAMKSLFALQCVYVGLLTPSISSGVAERHSKNIPVQSFIMYPKVVRDRLFDIRMYSWADFLYGHVLVQLGSIGQLKVSEMLQVSSVLARFAPSLTTGLPSLFRNRLWSLFVLVSIWAPCLLPNHKLGDVPGRGCQG